VASYKVALHTHYTHWSRKFWRWVARYITGMVDPDNQKRFKVDIFSAVEAVIRLYLTAKYQLVHIISKSSLLLHHALKTVWISLIWDGFITLFEEGIRIHTVTDLLSQKTQPPRSCKMFYVWSAEMLQNLENLYWANQPCNNLRCA